MKALVEAVDVVRIGVCVVCVFSGPAEKKGVVGMGLSLAGRLLAYHGLAGDLVMGRGWHVWLQCLLLLFLDCVMYIVQNGFSPNIIQCPALTCCTQLHQDDGFEAVIPLLTS